MGAKRKAFERLANANFPSREPLCLSCRIARRHASTAAAEAPQPHIQEPQVPPVTATGSQKAFRLLASPLLSRPPQITRTLTSFEKAFYLYQKRLNERLTLPFTRYFYYQKGTPLDIEWKRHLKVRKTAARDIGVYDAYGKEHWNDEVLVGSELAEPDNVVENLFRAAEGQNITTAKETQENEDTASVGGKGSDETVRVTDERFERPLPRETEADRTNDVRSLNRKLDRTLYLLVQKSDGQWRFPEDRVYGRETLREAAQRTTFAAVGPNLHHWLVANHPVAYFHRLFPETNVTNVPAHPNVNSSELHLEELGEKIFFMKARVMAGQVDLTTNEYGDKDWAWLVKEEVQEKVRKGYWKAISPALVER